MCCTISIRPSNIKAGHMMSIRMNVNASVHFVCIGQNQRQQHTPDGHTPAFGTSIYKPCAPISKEWIPMMTLFRALVLYISCRMAFDSACAELWARTSAPLSQTARNRSECMLPAKPAL